MKFANSEITLDTFNLQNTHLQIRRRLKQELQYHVYNQNVQNYMGFNNFIGFLQLLSYLFCNLNYKNMGFSISHGTGQNPMGFTIIPWDFG